MTLYDTKGHFKNKFESFLIVTYFQNNRHKTTSLKNFFKFSKQCPFDHTFLPAIKLMHSKFVKNFISYIAHKNLTSNSRNFGADSFIYINNTTLFTSTIIEIVVYKEDSTHTKQTLAKISSVQMYNTIFTVFAY